jgi:AcrR family transcriptional regulator
VNAVASRRPARGKAREQAVLSAVTELLGEVGYEAMTMDAVAARAHASKATIYKRWRGKPELVRAAVDALVAGRVPADTDTGSLRGDLLTVMRAMSGHLTTEFLAMMSGLVHAMRRDPALAGVLRSHLMDDAPAARLIVGRAVARGELRGGTEADLAALTHEVIEACLFRQLAIDAPLDEAFAAHVVDDLLMPVLTQAARRPRAGA